MSAMPITRSSAAEAQNAAALGFATQLLLATDRKQFRIASLWPFLWPPIRLGQIAFSYNSHGRPVAYVTWAFLTEEVSAELERDANRLLDLPEWNEGAELWIMDVVAPNGGAHALLRRLAAERFGRYRRVRAVRYASDGSAPRIVDLRRLGPSPATPAVPSAKLPPSQSRSARCKNAASAHKRTESERRSGRHQP